jgi:hypothetical protein
MAERVQLMSCADGISRADMGAFGGMVTHKTEDFAVPRSSSGTVYTNRGATATVTFGLPAPMKNCWFTFLRAAAPALVVQATGGAGICGVTDGMIACDDPGDAGSAGVVIVSDGVDWFIIGHQGTWGHELTPVSSSRKSKEK